jgi:hypothetical protein
MREWHQHDSSLQPGMQAQYLSDLEHRGIESLAKSYGGTFRLV